MKRIVKIITVSVLFLLMLLETALATTMAPSPTPTRPAAWNGAVASEFAGGSGTQIDPFLITNAEQLAYLETWSNNNPHPDRSYYFKVSSLGITFNDITTGFNSDTGLISVYVISTRKTYYLGTGIKGEDCGNQYDLFDNVPSERGAWYASKTSTEKISAPSEIKYWKPIEFGPKDENAPKMYINLTCYHGLVGLFVSGEDNCGLFSRLDGTELKLGSITSSVIIGRDNVGAIAGSGRSYIYNGYNGNYNGNNGRLNCMVLGRKNVGGVIGLAHPIKKDAKFKGYEYDKLYPSVSGISSFGMVIGEENVGGLAGSAGYIFDVPFGSCEGVPPRGLITGRVHGEQNVGGIVGVCSNGVVRNCISGVQITGENNVGGVAGSLDNAYVYNCEFRVDNTFYRYRGEKNVGGIAGYALDSVIEYCSTKFAEYKYVNQYGMSMFNGKENLGGIVGLLERSGAPGAYVAQISNCACVDYINGDTNVGGIVGKVSYWGHVPEKPIIPAISTCLGGCFRNLQSGIAGYLALKEDIENCICYCAIDGCEQKHVGNMNISVTKISKLDHLSTTNNNDGFVYDKDKWYFDGLRWKPFLLVRAHVHTPVGEWQANQAHHWVLCSCGAKAILGAHTSGSCSVCGFESDDHGVYPVVTPSNDPIGQTSTPTPSPSPTKPNETVTAPSQTQSNVTQTVVTYYFGIPQEYSVVGLVIVALAALIVVATVITAVIIITVKLKRK